MEQTLMIQVSPEALSSMIAEAVAGALEKVQTKEKKYLTRQEVCERFSISLPTLHSYINKGMVVAEKIGGRTLFEATQLERSVQAKSVCRYKHGRR